MQKTTLSLLCLFLIAQFSFSQDRITGEPFAKCRKLLRTKPQLLMMTSLECRLQQAGAPWIEGQGLIQN
jgi:hypothetical protein